MNYWSAQLAGSLQQSQPAVPRLGPVGVQAVHQVAVGVHFSCCQLLLEVAHQLLAPVGCTAGGQAQQGAGAGAGRGQLLVEAAKSNNTRVGEGWRAVMAAGGS